MRRRSHPLVMHSSSPLTDFASSARIFCMRKCFGMTPLTQILIVTLLITLSFFLGIVDVRLTGLHFGYQFSFSIPFAPLYEELLFRGLIFSWLLTQTSLARAIIFSSVLFGLWHSKNALWIPFDSVLRQVVYAMMIAVPLSYITAKTEWLFPAIVLHYINNIVAEILRML